VCNEVEEIGSGDFRQAFAEMAYQMLLSMSRRKRMQARAAAALGVLKSFSLAVPGGITARIDVEVETDRVGDVHRDLLPHGAADGLRTLPVSTRVGFKLHQIYHHQPVSTIRPIRVS
jgi:hypothetical protein